MTKKIRIVACAAAAFMAFTGVVETASAASPVKKATKLLQNKRFTTYISPSQGNDGIDRYVDLCANGRFFYKSTFVFTYGDYGNYSEDIQTGSWRVVRASFGRGRTSARVRVVNDNGGSATYTVVASSRGVSVDGQAVEVSRLSSCEA